MVRLIYKIDTIDLKVHGDKFEILATGTTATSIYKNPELVSCVGIPEKDLLEELCLEFYADDKDAMLQTLGKVEAKKSFLIADYPKLKRIVVKAETNEKSLNSPKF